MLDQYTAIRVDGRRNVQYSAPTAGSALDPDGNVDAAGTSEVDVKLAVEVALSEDAERVVATEDVTGISPSSDPKVLVDDAVHGAPLFFELRVRECEKEKDDESPSGPGRGEGAAEPRVANARKERNADANFISREADIKFKNERTRRREEIQTKKKKKRRESSQKRSPTETAKEKGNGGKLNVLMRRAIY